MSRPLRRRTPSTLSPGWVGRTLAAAADTAGWSEQPLPADDWLPQRTSSCPVMIPTKSWSCPDSDLEAEVHTHTILWLTNHFQYTVHSINMPDCSALNLEQSEAQSAWTESTCKRVNWPSKDITQTQQQRPQSQTVILTWHANKYKIYKLLQMYILCRFLRMYFWWSLQTSIFKDVLLVEFIDPDFWECTSEFMHVVFTLMPSKS